MKFYKYHGAGNDFLLADNRKSEYKLSIEDIVQLCDRHRGVGADGLILVEESDISDFRMQFFNPDGSGGMMCGNGARCIVAFAIDQNIPAHKFECNSKIYRSELLSSKANEKVIKLQLPDILNYAQLGKEEYFIDSGTAHFVLFVDDVESVNVNSLGASIRYSPKFAPNGTNVNFVQAKGNQIKIRTYERGVEAETLACGTGIVASALATYAKNAKVENGSVEQVSYKIRARIADLQVDFKAEYSNNFLSAKEIYLSGPAAYVCEVII